MYKRSIDLLSKKKSFFLWGPRQSGKTSLLKTELPKAEYIDLLKSDIYLRYLERPALLREQFEKSKISKQIIIDEVQKIPLLLDEVHYLIENTNHQFILCGSSARKLKRGKANLLGGRALALELRGLTSHELGDDFKLEQYINHGGLAPHYVDEEYRDMIRSYVADYLKQEILDEALVRNLPAFSQFLHTASFSDTEKVEYSTIASDVGVSAPTIKSYFEILEDTMIGEFLPSYRKRPKRRIQTSPKFYFFDVGVVNHLAKRGYIELGGELFGKAFENFIFQELRSYKAYRDLDLDLSYWSLSTNEEVDFILNDMQVAIEVKGATKVTNKHRKALDELAKDHKVKRRIIVSRDQVNREVQGVELIYYKDFLEMLWSGDLID